MRRILREMGRDVPPDAQDPESDEYARWLESVRRETPQTERPTRAESEATHKIRHGTRAHEFSLN